MTVKEIVVEYLKANGFDGLHTVRCDPCGCGIDSLAPCSIDCEIPTDCEPAYRIKCRGADCPCPCDAYDEDHKTDCFGAVKP